MDLRYRCTHLTTNVTCCCPSNFSCLNCYFQQAPSSKQLIRNIILLYELFNYLLQFFITLGEDIDYLNNVHTVFGEVAEGFEVIDKLNETYVDKENIPYKDIR